VFNSRVHQQGRTARADRGRTEGTGLPAFRDRDGQSQAWRCIWQCKRAPYLLVRTEAGPTAESTPSSRKRGASSAAWGSMPKSTMLLSTCPGENRRHQDCRNAEQQ